MPDLTATAGSDRPSLLPAYLDAEPSEAFDRQLRTLRELAGDAVVWLDPVPLQSAVPRSGAAALILADVSGAAYRQLEAFRAIEIPILMVTSEFGTVSMWDWEARDYLRRRGVPSIAPTSLDEFLDVCRALQARTSLRSAKMLAYLDDLGRGKQPDIFKRFYWWEDDCAAHLRAKFGVEVERRSYRELWARAVSIPQDRVAGAVQAVQRTVPLTEVTRRAQEDAMRLKLALGDELDETPGVISAGINCLNESATSTTTPCLAWSLLFEERGLIWGCEADLTSMITQYLLWTTLRVPAVMTNLYPFLMGPAVLKHERIPYFPARPDPENHILAAHCGFFGIVPQSWSTSFAVRPRVLEIVDENAHALDARLPEGHATIAKITSTFDSMTLSPAELTNYEQYANSDCINGAVFRVRDGYRFVERLPSHHGVIATGDITRRFSAVSAVLGLEAVQI